MALNYERLKTPKELLFELIDWSLLLSLLLSLLFPECIKENSLTLTYGHHLDINCITFPLLAYISKKENLLIFYGK